MNVNIEPRKPVHLLNLNDFSACPIWEFASDEEGIGGRDETWVRPIDANVVPRRSYTLVAAIFKDRRGREFNGCVAVSTFEGTVEILNGTIIEEAGPLFIPNPEVAFYGTARAALMAGLGLTEADLSPIAFTLKAPVEGIPGCFSGEFRLPPSPESRDQQLRWW